MKHHITLHNDIQEVPQLAAFIDEVAEACGIDMATAMSLNLAMEEAVVNVMNYAYPEGTHGDIHLEVKADDEAIVFTLRDSGVAFDSTAVPEVDVESHVGQRTVGGLGIHLVRTYMDDLSYRRVDGQNELTMIKKLNKQNKTE